MKRLFSPLFLIVLIGLLASCSTHKHNVRNDREATEHNERDKYIKNNPFKLTKDQKALIEESLTWIGTPYKYGEDKKHKGTDCSGFTMMVYLTALDKAIPRNSAKQAEACRTVKKSELIPGDLVFFATGKNKNKISHVGMMLTDEEFIHASSSKGVVISRLDNSYYTRNYVKGGRIK